MAALAPRRREYGENLGDIPRHADHCGASLLATPEIPWGANPCTERHDELVAETGTDPSAGSYKIVRPLKGLLQAGRASLMLLGLRRLAASFSYFISSLVLQRWSIPGQGLWPTH